MGGSWDIVGSRPNVDPFKVSMVVMAHLHKTSQITLPAVMHGRIVQKMQLDGLTRSFI
jgi:hypothetical protein